MPNNDKNKNSKKIPDGISSIADDEALTEIDFGDFLEESSKASPLFDGFHEDIENTEKSLVNEIQSLYDNIMSSGPKPIVPKPMSMLTGSDAEPRKVVLSDPTENGGEKSSLDELWMNPEDYFDADIPVVSLDDDGENESTEEEAAFADEKDKKDGEDTERNSIFSMIDMLKDETDNESGFSNILSEIEANTKIASATQEQLSQSVQLAAESSPVQEEEVAFDYSDFNWNDFEAEDESVQPQEEPAVSEPETTKAEESAAPEISSTEPETPKAAPASFDVDNIDTSSEEFDRELAFLLGDIPAAPEKEQTQTQGGFVVNVPDDGNDYEKAAAAPEKLYEAAPMSSGSVDESLQVVTEENKKGSKSGKKKAGGAGEVVRKIVLSISIITIIVSCGILVNTYFIEPYRFKSSSDDLVAQMSESINEKGDSTQIDEQDKQNYSGDYPEGMLAKYAKLYAANDDLRGWITISGFDINLPIAQGTNNSYYLKKDIYGKYTSYGVPFFDYRMTDFKNLHKNTVVYGHNMRHDDYIFGMLENYRFIDEGFKKAPVIECNTIYGDFTWFVYAVFITNSSESQDNGYLFPYNFIDVSDSKFAAYIEEIDKRKLYTTGVDINETDKILTLSTCCYDFDEARLVVVARLRREGESVLVDTSKAYYNEDPKYPQIWYDVNKKTNTHASDARW